MKKNLFYLSVFAALFTTSCSNNDEPNPSGNATGEQYMAVTIKDVNSGSRAVTDGDFEAAENNEGKITAENLYFIFFDEYGNAFPLAYANVNGSEVITNMVKPKALSQSENDGSDDGSSLKGILVLGKAKGSGYVGKKPSQVICVANPNSTRMEDLANMPLDDVLGRPTGYPKTEWNGQTSNFAMTNSTYVTAGENKKVVTAVDVTNCIFDTPEEAENTPAVIYLERLVAKVRVKYEESYKVQKRLPDGTVSDADNNFLIDNTPITFKARIDGWQLYNSAGQSNAFKKLNLSYDWEWTWNDATRHRSYWAESSHSTNFNKNTWDLYADDQFKQKSYDKDGANKTDNVVYCYENTGFTKSNGKVNTVTNRVQNEATAIVIKATITNADGEAIDMLRWAGAYYTLARLKERVAEAYAATYGGIGNSDYVLFVQEDGKNSYYAQYNIPGQGSIDMKELFSNILWWKDGVTSYYANIEHFGGLIGVVRNHIYDYEVDGIIGLGIPGNKPTIDDETESFLACHVRVLNWHLLKNNITLE